MFILSRTVSKLLRIIGEFWLSIVPFFNAPVRSEPVNSHYNTRHQESRNIALSYKLWKLFIYILNHLGVDPDSDRRTDGQTDSTAFSNSLF